MRDTNLQVPVGIGLDDLSMRDMVAPFFRRKGVFFAVFAIIAIAGAGLSFLLGPSYTSRMAILVNRERVDPLVSTGATTQLITSDNPVTQEEINSEVELLRSRDVLEQVVLANGLEKPHGFSMVDFLMPGQTREDHIARAVKRLAKALKIDAIKTSNVIQVTYSSPDPQLSYKVLKSLGDNYMTKHVSVHRPSGSFEFFAGETDEYHNELQRAEDKMRAFVQQNAIADPDEQKTNLAAQIASTIGLLHTAEQTAAADQERIRDDEQQMRATPRRSTTLQAAAYNDKLIDDLNTALLAAETKRTQLALKYDDKYPLVQEADQEIADDKRAVAQAEAKRYVSETTDRDPTYELLREDVARSEADLSAQHAAVTATQNSVKKMQAEMVKLDGLSLSMQDLQREAKAAESNYLLYLAKREQERTSNALDITRISNVAIAVPPAIPVLPTLSWPMVALIIFAAAVLLGIGAAYFVDYLDPTFKTPAQVVDTLGIPIVIAMPKRKTA